MMKSALARARNLVIGAILSAWVVAVAVEIAVRDGLLENDAAVSWVLSKAAAQQTGQQISNAIIVGKLFKQGAPPTVSSGTLTAGSTDFLGQVTAGGVASTPIVVTFSSAFGTAPICSVSASNATSIGVSYTTSTTALTMSGAGLPAGAVANYICVGLN